MAKRITPKEKLIARLVTAGLIPQGEQVEIESCRYSEYRRTLQSLPRTVILHRAPGCPVWQTVYADRTVTALNQAKVFRLQSYDADCWWLEADGDW